MYIVVILGPIAQLVVSLTANPGVASLHPDSIPLRQFGLVNHSGVRIKLLQLKADKNENFQICLLPDCIV